MRKLLNLFSLALFLVIAFAGNAKATTYNVPTDYSTIQDAITAAVNGDVINLEAGTYNYSTTITVNKDLTITGVSGSSIINTSGTGNLFMISTSGVTISNLTIIKTDDNVFQEIIGIQGSNFEISNCTISAQFVIGDGEVTRALVISGGLTGLLIDGNTFYNVRQPAYISGTTTGTVSNNYTYNTKGFVIEGGNLTFSNNTWGTNVYDIAILSSCPSAYYTDIVTMSNNNNGAVIEDQRYSPAVLSVVRVDASTSYSSDLGGKYHPYSSITPAIARVITGGTILVAAGTYNENLTVNKNLELRGANFGIDPNTGSRVSESIIQNGNINMTSANTVILDGFHVYVTTAINGISLGGSTVADIKNNIIERFGSTTGNTVRGIETTAGPGSKTIVNNLFTGDASNGLFGSHKTWNSGIYMNGASSTVNITNNTFENCRTALNLDDFNSGITVSGNTFSNNGTFISFGGTTATNGSYVLGANDYKNLVSAFINLSNVTTSFRLDISAGTYNGVSFSLLPLSTLFILEATMYHRTRSSRNGLVYYVPNTLFVLNSVNNGIQTAIDYSAANDVIKVATGTFNQDITINKTLSLVGNGSSNTTISGPIGGNGSTIYVQAAGVLIDGFSVTRDGNNLTDWNNAGLNSAGIAVQSQGNYAEIRNCNIYGNRTGIDINNSNGNNIHNNQINNNRTGMIFRNQTDNTTCIYNEIKGNWTVGILFLDASGGTNVPVQTAITSNFNNNDISGNWYGQIVDRQVGGSLPPAGTLMKNFECNWYGTASPTVSTANSAEPGYSAQIPVAFGGTAVAPGGQPDILGAASANIDYLPYLVSNGGPCTGAPVTNVTQSKYYTQIQPAINEATSGDVIEVAAGTYIEDINVNKALDIRGPNYGINPNSGLRVPEAVIKPATSNPDPYSLTAEVNMYVSTSNVSIKGFTFDGDNPTLTSTVNFNGANMDVSSCIASYEGVGHITIENNIIKNIAYAGVDFDNYINTNSTGNNNIINNKFDNLMSSVFGIGIVIYDNFYANISGNVMTRVKVGIQTGNFYRAKIAGTDANISNNIIQSQKRGIFYNLHYSDASPFLIDNNTITTYPGGAFSYGIAVTSQQGSVSASILNNNVDGANVGIVFWNCPTSANLTVNGGTLSNCEYGVRVDNFDGYGPSNGASSSATVTNVTFNNPSIAATYILDNGSNTNGATVNLNVSTGNVFNSCPYDIKLNGKDATAVNNSGASLNWLVANNGVAANQTLIQTSINGAINGDVINVAAGTYAENVNVNKNVSVLGTDKATCILNAATNTTVGGNAASEAWWLVNTGNTATIKNFTFDGTGKQINHAIQSRGSLAIENCEIKNIKYMTYFGRGIVFYTGTNSVKNCNLSNIERIGIHVRGNVLSPNPTATIENITFTGKGLGDWLDYGVEFGAGGNGTVSTSTITNCTGETSNDNSTSAGILATDYYGGGTSATITNSTITGNTTGIAVGYENSDLTTLTAHENDLSGNSKSITQENPAISIDAECNWFGSADGNVVYSKVSGNVDFIPYWITLTGTCTGGLAPDNSSMTLVNDYNTSLNIWNDDNSLNADATVASGATAPNEIAADADFNNQHTMSFGGTQTNIMTTPYNTNSGRINNNSNKTLFVYFKTGTDVNTRQVVYEAGGIYSGFNVYIYNGRIYLGIWNSTQRRFFNQTISADTKYLVSVERNGSVVRSSINGVISSTALFNGFSSEMTSSDNGIGGSYNRTRFSDIYSGNGISYKFNGKIAELLCYNTEDQGIRFNVLDYIDAKYGTNFGSSYNSKSIAEDAISLYTWDEGDATNITEAGLKVTNNSNELNVIYSTLEAQTGNLGLYDLNGSLVNAIFNGELLKGENNFTVNANYLTSGVYFIKAETNSGIESKQVIIIK